MSDIGKSRAELVDEKYRPLKRLMKKVCKKIENSVEKRQLPSTLVMNEFMAQAKVMVAYPGFGDKHYSEFTNSCEELYRAFKWKDIKLFAEKFAVVISLKKECHGRYK